MNNDHDTLQEVLQRTTRIESRIVQLGDHVGANLRSKQRIEVKYSTNGMARVEIDAMDVSLSRIAAELKNHGFDAPASVWHDGRLVATLYPKTFGTVVQAQPLERVK